MCVYSPRVGGVFFIDSKIYLFLHLYNFSLESNRRNYLTVAAQHYYLFKYWLLLPKKYNMSGHI